MLNLQPTKAHASFG